MLDYSKTGLVPENTLIRGKKNYVGTQVFDSELEYAVSWSSEVCLQKIQMSHDRKKKTMNNFSFTGKETDGNYSWKDRGKLLIQGNSTIHILKFLIRDLLMY